MYPVKYMYMLHIDLLKKNTEIYFFLVPQSIESIVSDQNSLSCYMNRQHSNVIQRNIFLDKFESSCDDGFYF